MTRASLSEPLKYATSIKTSVSMTAGWPLLSCTAIQLIGSLWRYASPYVTAPVCAHLHRPAGRHSHSTTGRPTLRENWREPGVQRWGPQTYISLILSIQIKTSEWLMKLLVLATEACWKSSDNKPQAYVGWIHTHTQSVATSQHTPTLSAQTDTVGTRRGMIFF